MRHRSATPIVMLTARGEPQHMFERFAKSAESRGSGLGLGIARSLVRAHAGEISSTSEFGRGTTVRFILPAVTRSASSPWPRQ